MSPDHSKMYSAAISRLASSYVIGVISNVINEDDSQIKKVPIMPKYEEPVTTNGSTESSSPSSSTKRQYTHVPEVVSWSTEATKALEPPGAGKNAGLNLGNNIDKNECLQVFANNSINMCMWYAVVAGALYEMKSPNSSSNSSMPCTKFLHKSLDDAVSLASAGAVVDAAPADPADADEIAQVAAAIPENATDFFLRPPSDFAELMQTLPNGQKVELAVKRCGENLCGYSVVRAPSLSPMYDYEAGNWLGSLADASLYFTLPYLLLIVAGAVDVVQNVPTDPDERSKAFAAHAPCQYKEGSGRYMSYGCELGQAPALTDGSKVCAVSDKLIKYAFGSLSEYDTNYRNGTDNVCFVDSFTFINIRTPTPDFLAGKSFDVTLIPWETYRLLLSWFGGGLFLPMEMAVDPQDGITMSILRPLTYTIVTPNPSKADYYAYHYATWTFETIDYSLTVRQVVEQALRQGETMYTTSRYSKPSGQDNFCVANMQEAKDFLLTCLAADDEVYKANNKKQQVALQENKTNNNNNKNGNDNDDNDGGASVVPESKNNNDNNNKNKDESDEYFLEVRNGASPTEYGSEACPKNIWDTNAREWLLSKERSSDVRAFAICVIEAGTRDNYTASSSVKRHNDSDSAGYNSHQPKSTHPGWVGLQNLGNTCYMNSALQCISHAMPFVDKVLQLQDADLLSSFSKQDELLKQATEADPTRKPPASAIASTADTSITLAYRGMLHNVFEKASDSSVYSPSNLKKVVGKRFRRYDGYEQQDAIEFVNTFIDVIHEELNPTAKCKDYRERSTKDNAIPTGELSRIYWEDAKKNNKSFAFDQWYGQMHSDIQCLCCGHVATIFDAFSTLPVSLKETETNPFDIPVVFFSDVCGTAQNEDNNNNNNGNDDTPHISSSSLASHPPKTISGKYVHTLMIRVRLSKGSSIRDLQTSIFEAIVNDKEATDLGLNVKVRDEVSCLRIQYNCLYAVAPVDRVYGHENFCAFISDLNGTAQKILGEYHSAMQAHEKEQREIKDKKEKEEKERKKAAEAEKKRLDEEKQQRKLAGLPAPDESLTESEDAAPAAAAAAAPVGAHSSAAAASSQSAQSTENMTIAERARALIMANNNNNNNNSSQNETQSTSNDGKKDEKQQQEQPELQFPKPIQPFFYLYVLKCVPDFSTESLRNAILFPLVVPAASTHKEMYDFACQAARSCMAPIINNHNQTIDVDGNNTINSEIECVEASVVPIYSYDRPVLIRRDDAATVFDAGKENLGVVFQKSNFEVRVLRFVYDPTKFQTVSGGVTKHSTLDKIPGPGYKAPPTTLASCIADSALPQDLTGMDQFYCPQCKQHQDGRKTETVMVLPPLLVVQLKRFYVMPDGMSMGKISTAVPYPELLDLNSAVSPEVRESGKSTIYRLFGSIHHSGSLSFGHYTAVVAGEEPLPIPEDEAAKKKQQEEEAAEKKRLEEEAAAAAALAAKNEDEIAKYAKMTIDDVPKKTFWRDADIMIKVKNAREEMKKRAIDAAKNPKPVVVADAVVEGDQNDKKLTKEDAPATAVVAPAPQPPKPKRKPLTKRVWLDCNDSWVSTIKSHEAAMNPTSVYVMFYQRVEDPEELEQIRKNEAEKSAAAAEKNNNSHKDSGVVSSSPSSTSHKSNNIDGCD